MLGNHRAVAFSLTAVLMLALTPAAGHAATTVQVSLWDQGADAEMPTGLMYGMPGVELSKATMGIKPSLGSAPAGEITFDVTNDSKDTIHEMIVVDVKEAGKPLPYSTADQRVDEEAAGDHGEVSELDPGKSGSLTVSLDPGTYLLICNIPGHYEAGMWTEFTVTP
jgi:uncharacterized cupredoxin-like copper-binding protein